MTVTIRRLSVGLQVDGYPDGIERFVRPDAARLLAHGRQYAELIVADENGEGVADGFAHPTPDGETLLVRAGANG